MKAIILLITKSYLDLPENAKIDTKLVAGGLGVNLLVLTIPFAELNNWLGVIAKLIGILSGITALVLALINIRKALKK